MNEMVVWNSTISQPQRSVRLETKKRGGQGIGCWLVLDEFKSFWAAVHNWYHFLSLYLSLRLCAVLAKSSASFISFAEVSSSWPSFSPRSIIIIRARDTSLLAVVACAPNSSSFEDGPGICLATVRDARPLASPTLKQNKKHQY